LQGLDSIECCRRGIDDIGLADQRAFAIIV
jgi:hypothetical protein